MVITWSQVGFPPVRVAWFEDRPHWRDCFRLAEYKQCAAAVAHPGFVRQAFHTKLVSLEGSADDLMAGFQPRTRSFVRQAQRLGVEAGIEDDRERFLSAYNRFAAARGLALIRRGHVLAQPGLTVVTKASLNGQTLAMRGYLIDRIASRARNLVNCTFEPAADSQAASSLPGAAHRYLIFSDMLRFQADGIRQYDFGGYALGTSDPKLANINRFKDSFGGQVVAEVNYVSWPLHLVLAARRRLRRLRLAADGLSHDGSVRDER